MARGLALRFALSALLVSGVALSHAPPAAAATVTISGTVSTPAGALVFATVMVRDADSNVYYDNVAAADEGAFSFTAPEGPYTMLSFEGYTKNVGGVASSFTFNRGPLTVSGDTDLGSVVVPARPVAIDVVDQNDQPPTDVRQLSVTCDWNDEVGNSILHWSSATTSASPGPSATVWGSPGPPGDVADDGSPGCYAQAHRTSPNYKNQDFEVSTTEDNELTLVIPDFVTISGTVTASDPRMKPISVYARPMSETQVGGDQVTPAADGSYALSVPPGDYAVMFRFDNDDHTFGGTLFTLDVAATEAPVSLDKHFGTRSATVHVVDSAGEPVEGLRPYQDCLREIDLPVPGGSGLNTSEGFWSSLPEEGVSYPADHEILLPAVDDNDPAWTCNFQLTSEEVYRRGPLPANPTTEMTLVLDSFGWFSGPPTGGEVGDDGVPDLTEAAGPNGGDTNYDGTPDSAQDNVTTLPGNGGTPAENEGYVSIAGPAGSTLTGVSTMPATDAVGSPPQGATLPTGLNSFTLEGIAPGSTQQVRIYAPAYEVNAYAKYDPATQAWSLLPGDRVSVNHDFTDWVEITLTDGGIGDADGVADGKIVDPGGPAVIPTGDTTPPEVTGRATTQPNGAGWYRSNVRIDWSATDESGVAQQPADTFVSTQGSNVTATSPQVCDNAPTPNCGTGTVDGLKIDKTAPNVAVTGVSHGATYTLGAVPVATCTASDSLSGLAAPCKVTKTSGGSSGIGPFTYTATVTDRAGNTRTATSSYRVVYRFDGFLSPLNNPPAPVSIFRAGSTVPVAFTLKRAGGQTVTPAAKPVWVSPLRGARTSAPVNEAVSSAKGSTGSVFAYSNGAWRYNWSTKGLASGYLYRIGVRLDDGTTRYLTVGIR